MIDTICRGGRRERKAPFPSKVPSGVWVQSFAPPRRPPRSLLLLLGFPQEEGLLGSKAPPIVAGGGHGGRLLVHHRPSSRACDLPGLGQKPSSLCSPPGSPLLSDGPRGPSGGRDPSGQSRLVTLPRGLRCSPWEAMGGAPLVESGIQGKPPQPPSGRQPPFATLDCPVFREEQQPLPDEAHPTAGQGGFPPAAKGGR